MYDLGDFDEGMVHIPYAVTEHTFLHLFGLATELLEVVDILLKILLEELLCVEKEVPLGSRSYAALRSASATGSSSEEEGSTK